MTNPGKTGFMSLLFGQVPVTEGGKLVLLFFCGDTGDLGDSPSVLGFCVPSIAEKVGTRGTTQGDVRFALVFWVLGG